MRWHGYRRVSAVAKTTSRLVSRAAFLDHASRIHTHTPQPTLAYGIHTPRHELTFFWYATTLSRAIVSICRLRSSFSALSLATASSAFRRAADASVAAFSMFMTRRSSATTFCFSRCSCESTFSVRREAMSIISAVVAAEATMGMSSGKDGARACSALPGEAATPSLLALACDDSVVAALGSLVLAGVLRKLSRLAIAALACCW